MGGPTERTGVVDGREAIVMQLSSEDDATYRVDIAVTRRSTFWTDRP
jgi:hypothetical protein